VERYAAGVAWGHGPPPGSPHRPRPAPPLHHGAGPGSATVQEVAEGIALDWDGEGRLLGIEILDASKRLADPEALRRFALEALPVLR
jgi:uncharacterized protein YuzE